MKKTLLLLLALLLSAPAFSAQLLDRIVAVVEDHPILQSELDQATFEALNRLRQQGITPPPLNELRHKVLEQLILQQVQLQRAQRRGIQVTDEEVNAQLQQLAAANGLTLEQFIEALDRQAPGSYERLRKQIKEQLMIQKLRQLEVVRQVSVTREELQQFLKQVGQGSTVSYHLRHILVPLPNTPTREQVKATEKKAQTLRDRLAAGADFGRMAVEHSAGAEALQGGDLGWHKASELPDSFLEAVKNLKPGQISPVIRTAGGFHILQLVDKRDEALNPVAQQQALNALRQRKASELFDLWLRRLRDEAHVKIYLDEPATLKASPTS